MAGSVIANHPYRAEIEAAIREGVPVRQIGRRFSVEPTAVHRHKHRMLAGSPAPSPKAEPAPSRPARGRGRTKREECNVAGDCNMQRLNLDQPPDQQGLDAFDLLTLPRFPWAAGETPPPAPVAQQLRDQQRRFGIEPVKRQVLALIADNSAVRSDVTLAQQLDVEPRTIARWRGILAAEGKAGLSDDPAKTVTEELALLETVRRACLRRLANDRASDSAMLAAADRVLRTVREARDLREAHGLVRPIQVKEPDPDPSHPDYDAIMGARILSTAAKVILVLTGRTLGIGDEVEDAIANDRNCNKLLGDALEERFQARVAEEVARRTKQAEPDDAPDQDDADDAPEPTAVAEPVAVVEPTDPEPNPAPEPEPVVEPAAVAEPERPRPQVRERVRPFDGLVLDNGR